MLRVDTVCCYALLYYRFKMHAALIFKWNEKGIACKRCVTNIDRTTHIHYLRSEILPARPALCFNTFATVDIFHPFPLVSHIRTLSNVADAFITQSPTHDLDPHLLCIKTMKKNGRKPKLRAIRERLHVIYL